jgi:energy-coupling factor transporter ATP-binding protein EcfA2
LAELATLNRIKRHEDYWALREVDFEVEAGAVFCLVGENGSGKSTTLQLAAGIFAATAGEVEVNGRVSALLELGAGFNPEFSGRDNVFLAGTVQGLEQRSPPLQGHRTVRRDRRVHQPAGQDLLLRHVGSPGVCRGDQRRSGNPAGGRGPGSRGLLLPATVHAQGA